MDRRVFLKNSLVAGSALMMPQFIKAFNNSGSVFNGKRLVVIQLSGGNDGLNTIVPYRSELYYQFRPSISIQPANVIKVSEDLGMHPSLQKMASLFMDGEMSVFNHVGYPNQNKSHFRATDIWLTASDADKYYSTGWIGNYLDAECETPHSAIEIGTSMSLALKGNNGLGMAFVNPAELKRASDTSFFNTLKDVQANGNDSLNYLYKTFTNTKSSTDNIFEKYKTYSSNIEYANTRLAKSLKTIGALINSGIETAVYYVNMGGFDTHSNQHTRHKQLLSKLDDALFSFIKDLKKGGSFDDTLIMVFSEFGRRMNENGSKGTDHGKANNVWLIGSKLKKPGFINGVTNLELNEENDLLHKMDFREIYTSILKNWLNARQPIIKGNFKTFKV